MSLADGWQGQHSAGNAYLIDSLRHATSCLITPSNFKHRLDGGVLNPQKKIITSQVWEEDFGSNFLFFLNFKSCFYRIIKVKILSFKGETMNEFSFYSILSLKGRGNYQLSIIEIPQN
ncbi:hypothetical protein [Okeania sp. KiyG1]|uniref:hypothetical protein n=1 Tax=Okeania sp. KiyG1 TaxID=2720165 RepID=UPI00192209BC|nr:hypothetical protein [Okeania sp. KiyG1]